MPEPIIPEELVRHLATRDKKRADAVLDTLAALTPREEQLVREAAVMGYVRGLQHGRLDGYDAMVPNDADILAEVVDTCLAYPGLYPTIAGLREGATDG